jgi:hypothetical protein
MTGPIIEYRTNLRYEQSGLGTGAYRMNQIPDVRPAS